MQNPIHGVKIGNNANGKYLIYFVKSIFDY
jgi:hypothetical protein